MSGAVHGMCDGTRAAVSETFFLSAAERCVLCDAVALGCRRMSVVIGEVTGAYLTVMPLFFC